MERSKTPESFSEKLVDLGLVSPSPIMLDDHKEDVQEEQVNIVDELTVDVDEVIVLNTIEPEHLECPSRVTLT